MFDPYAYRSLAFLLFLAFTLPAQAQTSGCSRSEPGWRCPDAFTVVQQAENPYTFGSPGYNGGGNVLLQAFAGTHSAAYQYAVYYGAGNNSGRIRRPVVVVDGIDVGFSFGNGRSADEIYNTLLNRENVVIGRGPPASVRLGDDVLADGYDLVILDYGDALDFIERNALALVHLITRINGQLGPGERIEAVVGPSLGALVSRYALTYMEANGIPHNVPLYVSFDGAHQGGHIPVGIQQFADDIVHHADFRQFYPSDFTDQVDAVFGSPAVRELLVFNAFAANYAQNPAHPSFRRDPLRTDLLNGLLALGDYPMEPRKVAIVNGSPTALSQLDGDGSTGRVAPGDAQLDFDAYLTYGIGGFRTRMEAFAAPASSGIIYRRRDYTCYLFCAPNGIPENPSQDNPDPWVTSATGALDSAPGGWRDTGNSLAAPFEAVYTWSDVIDRLRSSDLGALVEPTIYFARQLLANGNVHLDIAAPTPNHSFISTLSALDYNTTSGSRYSLVQSAFAGQNLYQNILADVDEGIAAARTPFDGFYLAGDDGVEGRENQTHIALTPGIASYVLRELARLTPVTRQYARSTTVHGDVLPPGSTVFVGDYVSVTYSGPVSAAAGVTFKLGREARVTFQDQANLVGSSASPVRFERWTSTRSEREAGPWNRVAVTGDGSLFSHVILEGGYKTIDIAARGVVLRDVRSIGGWRGLSTYFTPRGARSEVTLDRLTIESSSSVGLVLDHADATLTQSAILSSAEAGVWVRDSRVRIRDSSIERNGVIRSWRDGIEAYSGAEVLMDDGAFNTVQTNGRFEIAAFYGARVYAGRCQIIDDAHDPPVRGDEIGVSKACIGGGYNVIRDARGGVLVYNGSSSPISAQMNYWGGTPSVSRFSGAISYTPYLSSPPSPLFSPDEVREIVERDSDERRADRIANPSNLLLQYRRDPSSTESRWQKSVAAVRQSAANGDEASVLALLSQALASGDYENALSLVESAGNLALSDNGSTDIALAKITLFEQAGQTLEALRVLDAASESLPANLVATLRSTLSDARAYPEVATASTAVAPALSRVVRADVFPNPTTGDADLSVTLDSEAVCLIEVFAVDGRRVISLPTTYLSAGIHILRLPVGNLAAGIYVARVQADNGSSPSLVRRFVITR